MPRPGYRWGTSWSDSSDEVRSGSLCVDGSADRDATVPSRLSMRSIDRSGRGTTSREIRTRRMGASTADPSWIWRIGQRRPSLSRTREASRRSAPPPHSTSSSRRHRSTVQSRPLRRRCALCAPCDRREAMRDRGATRRSASWSGAGDRDSFSTIPRWGKYDRTDRMSEASVVAPRRRD